MKRLLYGLAAAIVVSGVGLAAQTGTKDPKMADGMMTVTGCVTAGTRAGEFMLTDAMMAGAMTSDKSTSGVPASSTGHKMSYTLMGGDLKMQVGHKVEIIGMMDKAMMKSMASMSEKQKMEKMAAMTEPMKLDVKSVKMVAMTCP
jgi:hypothetical protein